MAETLDPLRRADRIILVGPWLGEVGFEVLYWIPLLRWCVREWPELQGRLVAVSRGGVHSWYEGIADRYFDLFGRYDRETFWRRLREERGKRRARGLGSLKQVERTNWEQEIERWVADELGEPVLDLLHPEIVYRTAGLVSILADSDEGAFPRWNRPERGPLEHVLPPDYIAVRFYRNKVFGGAEAEEFALEATRLLAGRLPVVVLDGSAQRDPKHPDYRPDAATISLEPHIPFAANLAVQSIAIANARAFVGTFGGLSFLAPNYGVPSFAFWSTTSHGDPGTKKRSWRDLDIAERAYARPRLGGYCARYFRDAPVEELVASIPG